MNNFFTMWSSFSVLRMPVTYPKTNYHKTSSTPEERIFMAIQETKPP